MGRRKKTSKHSRAKTVLRLPDLEQSKNAVLNSLAAASSQESERMPSMNSSINVCSAAVRRLAHEAADNRPSHRLCRSALSVCDFT
jgi:hypothetical protein